MSLVLSGNCRGVNMNRIAAPFSIAVNREGVHVGCLRGRRVKGVPVYQFEYQPDAEGRTFKQRVDKGAPEGTQMVFRLSVVRFT